MVGLLSVRKIVQPHAASVLQGGERAPATVCGITLLRMHNSSILPHRKINRGRYPVPILCRRYRVAETEVVR